MNPYLVEFEVKERQREMLDAASRQRLVNLYNAQYPGKTDKLFLVLADLLIGLGETLKRRHGRPQMLTDGLCRE